MVETGRGGAGRGAAAPAAGGLPACAGSEGGCAPPGSATAPLAPSARAAVCRKSRRECAITHLHAGATGPVHAWNRPTRRVRVSERRPPRTRFALEVFIGRRVVRDAHVRGVVGDLLPARSDTMPSSITSVSFAACRLERARHLRRPLGRIHPVHLVVRRNARQRLLRRPDRLVQRGRQQPRLRPVRLVEQLALGPDDQRAAALVEFLVADLDGVGRIRPPSYHVRLIAGRDPRAPNV